LFVGLKHLILEINVIVFVAPVDCLSAYINIGTEESNSDVCIGLLHSPTLPAATMRTVSFVDYFELDYQGSVYSKAMLTADVDNDNVGIIRCSK
jgi:hypothetical protein